MKLRQNVRHFASRRALETPIVGDKVHDWLVSLHTRVFLDRAPEPHREDRREHLDAFFDASMDTYLVALQSGYTEAEAREITHIIANFDFYNHGWVEMMEFPPGELDDHYQRYREFFDTHSITLDDPLGEFRPDAGLPTARATPERLEDAEAPYAEGGYADDVYVQDGEEVRRGGKPEPADVDLADAPGIDDGTE